MCLSGHKVAVAVSGGVDSLCSLLLLKNAGIDIFAIHGLFLPENSKNIAAIRAACDRLGVELVVADLCAQFEQEIIQPFYRAQAEGLTPNPCAWCNKKIKFGQLWQIAAQHGATKLATGHYSRLEPNPYQANTGEILGRPRDTKKDQSYFLALLDQKQLGRLLFPLENLDKAQCRPMAEKAGLRVPVPAESQDVCFTAGHKNIISDGAGKPGPIILQDGKNQVIGRHAGLNQYTIGQRKGLAITWKEPLYVLGKNLAENALLVGPKALLGQARIKVQPVSLHVPFKLWPAKIFAQLRYRAALIPCVFDNDKMTINLKENVFPAAPGQVAVIYDGSSRVLLGGIIID